MAYIDNKDEFKNIRPSLNDKLVSMNDVTSLLGTQQDIRFYELEPAEVIDVILNDTHPNFTSYEDIGKVKVRPLYSQTNLGYADDTLLGWAKSGQSNVKNYPLKHEVVIVAYYITREATIDSAGPILTPKILYYFDRLNVLNSVNHNAMLDISLTKEFKEGNGYTQPDELILGEDFNPNAQIHPLESKEGDIIYEGRFGNSIRFGSNPKTGTPEILIRAGQNPNVAGSNLLPILEDINKDFNSIWASTDRVIPLEIACTNQKSYEAPTSFDGKQIIINSDRIILNAKKEEIIGYSNKNINFSANGTFNINTNGSTNFNSKEIYLGLDATEKVVKGDTLVSLLSELITQLSTMTVLTGTGPSSPPTNAQALVTIKQKLQTCLSKQNYTL